jgi:hypothetical protein
MNKDLFLAENQAHQTLMSKSEDECAITSDLSVKHSPEWTLKMIQQEGAKDGDVKDLTNMTDNVSNRDEAPLPPKESPGAPANTKVLDAHEDKLLTPRRMSKLDISKWADSGLPSGFTYTQNTSTVSEKTSQAAAVTPKVPQKPVVRVVTPTAVEKQEVGDVTQAAAPKQQSEMTPTKSWRPRVTSADIDMTPTRAERERVAIGTAEDVYKESMDRPQSFLPLMPTPRKETTKKDNTCSVRAYNRPDEWLSPVQKSENPQTKYKFKRVVDSSEILDDEDVSEEEEVLTEEVSSNNDAEVEEITLLPATLNLNSSFASVQSVSEYEDEDTVQEEDEESSPSNDPVVGLIVAAQHVVALSAEETPAKTLTPLERLRQAQSTSRQAVAKAVHVQKDHTKEILADKTIIAPSSKKESSRSDFYGSMSAIPFLLKPTNVSPKHKSMKTKTKRKSSSKGGDKDKKEGEASVAGDEIAASASGSFDASLEEESHPGSELATEPDRTSHIMNEMASVKSVSSDNAASHSSIVSISGHSFIFDDEELEAKKAMWKSMSALDNEATDRPQQFLPLQPSKRKEKKVSASVQNAKSRAYNRPDEWLSPNQKGKVKQGWKEKRALDPNQINLDNFPETSGDDPVIDVPDKEEVQPAPVFD